MLCDLTSWEREGDGEMGFVESIGRYRVGRTIGAGTFAKVRLAVDADTGATVAVKVIDKRMVIRNNLMYQVMIMIMMNNSSV